LGVISPRPHDRPALGLRERKKARTRAAIQQEALRLFRDQGYEATTIEQIAEAAEFSPSTFFRYFPTKEDVVMYDDLDPAVIAAYQAQPPSLGPIPALRNAIRQVFTELPPDAVRDMRERFDLIMAVPELRSRMVDELIRNIEMVAGLVAQRVGGDPGDLAVRAFAGSFIGAVMGVLFTAPADGSVDYFVLLDETMEQLERGLTL
jgi:AcrR family transcriptional regulator